jgi:Uma2 family endonuclease
MAFRLQKTPQEGAYNAAMGTHTDFREAVDHLPEAAVLILDGISWDDYEQLLEDFQDRPGVRITYNQGRLEIVTTSSEHEQYKDFVLRLVQVLCEESDLELQSYGGTTWKRKRDLKGTEPDTCFYIANARQVIGKRVIDLLVDPPPDVVVEIDKSNQSLNKFPIYAAFGVPEIWRFDLKHRDVRIYQLSEIKSYVESYSSRFFPILTSGVLVDFTERSRSDGQMAALSTFRRWLKERGARC